MLSIRRGFGAIIVGWLFRHLFSKDSTFELAKNFLEFFFRKGFFNWLPWVGMLVKLFVLVFPLL